MEVLGASDVRLLLMQKCEGGVQLEQYQEAAMVVPQYLSQLVHNLPVEVASVPARKFHSHLRQELAFQLAAVPADHAVNPAAGLMTDSSNTHQQEMGYVDSPTVQKLHMELVGLVPFQPHW